MAPSARRGADELQIAKAYEKIVRELGSAVFPRRTHSQTLKTSPVPETSRGNADKAAVARVHLARVQPKRIGWPSFASAAWNGRRGPRYRGKDQQSPDPDLVSAEGEEQARVIGSPCWWKALTRREFGCRHDVPPGPRALPLLSVKDYDRL